MNDTKNSKPLPPVIDIMNNSLGAAGCMWEAGHKCNYLQLSSERDDGKPSKAFCRRVEEDLKTSKWTHEVYRSKICSSLVSGKI